MHLDASPPPVAEFIALRAAEGWGEIGEETAQASLAAGLINVCAYEGDTLAGFGRVVGDGVLYFYIQDLIVAPSYRRQGLGSQLLKRLLSEIKNTAAPGASIALMAAHGKEDFYKPFGFIARPNDIYGAGMIQVV